MNVLEYLKSETLRQSGTPAELEGMTFAWAWLNSVPEGYVLSEDTFKNLSGLITGRFEYRQTEVTFRQMSYPPVPADSVPRAMKRFVENLNRPDLMPNSDPGSRQGWAEYFTREFLIIHPFADGNGRVGSLLWNYLNDTLANPEPMPYFFGE